MPLSLFRTVIQRSEAGLVKIVSGALCTVYDTMADGSSPVTAEGSVSVGAIKSTIYSDRAGVTTKANPLTSNAQGYIEAYAPTKELHILVTLADGTVFGLPWVPHIGVVGIGTLEVSPTALGAKGDGLDASASANVLAIQAAIDSIPAPTEATYGAGIDIILPAGEFRVNSPIFVPSNIRIKGQGKRSTILRAIDSNQDVIRLQGSRCVVQDLGIIGTAGAGTGVGIRHIGTDRNGVDLLTVHETRISDVWIEGISGWGIELKAVPASEIFNTFLTRVNVTSTISGGALKFGEGCSSPSLVCVSCNFNGTPGTGTYGVGAMSQGSVHLDTTTNASFIGCIFEPTNATCVSLLTCNTVVFYGCKFTQFVGGDNGRYFITTSSFNSNILFSGCEFLNFSTTKGPRILKTDENGGAGGNTNMTFQNCQFDTKETAGHTDDILLGSSLDQLNILDCIVAKEWVPEGARDLVVFNNVDSTDRRHIPYNTLSIARGVYNKGHILMGGRHLFMDALLSFRTRWFNDSTGDKPTSATDGDLVVIDNAYKTLEDTATPSVAVLNGGRNFKCSPAGAVVITNFDDATDGQTIRILFTNANVTINNGGNFKLIGNFLSTASDILVLTFTGGIWYEVSRSPNV